MNKPVYIKLPVILVEERYNLEDEKIAYLLNQEYKPEEIETESDEYVLVSGNTTITRFYEDTEGRVTASTGHTNDYGDSIMIQYNLTIREYLERTRDYITVI